MVRSNRGDEICEHAVREQHAIRMLERDDFLETHLAIVVDQVDRELAAEAEDAAPGSTTGTAPGRAARACSCSSGASFSLWT